VIMPALGMAQETGKVLRWLKAEGEEVTKGEPLMEVETDKVTVEIEAPADGLLAALRAPEGADVPVGQTVAVIVAPGRIDRSPCGTGTSARLAVLHARGHLAPGQGFIHESIIGSRFEAGIACQTTVGGRPGIVPTIAGQAWITGVFQHGFDPTDPFRGGYTLPDLWFS